MKTNYLDIIGVVINFAILATVIVVIYKAIQYFKGFIIANKERDKKLDTILSKLEDKEDN